MARRPPRLLTSACGALALIAACAPRTPAAATDPPSPAPRLVWTPRAGDPSRAVVEVVGANPMALAALNGRDLTPEAWRSLLVVRVLRDGDGDELPPLLGRYRVDGVTLRFEPRFPLEPGVRYRAEFDPAPLQALAAIESKDPAPPSTPRLTSEFTPPERPTRPNATVTAIYPTASTLPENLLRFYLHFSAPMSRGESYRHIRLLDGSGRPIVDPFLELEEELWSADGRRFTLLLDPGRIKRGLRPREEVGPVLEAGRSYELAIDPGWPDAGGRPLRTGARKSFRAGPPDETSPDPKTWAIRPPKAGTREPMEARFPEPLDRALLERLIAVRDDANRSIAGAVAVDEAETLWRFTPGSAWRPGGYRLVIGTDLEDAAGNSVARPFEVDALAPISRRIVAETVARTFHIEPAATPSPPGPRP